MPLAGLFGRRIVRPVSQHPLTLVQATSAYAVVQTIKAAANSSFIRLSPFQDKAASPSISSPYSAALDGRLDEHEAIRPVMPVASEQPDASGGAPSQHSEPVKLDLVHSDGGREKRKDRTGEGAALLREA
jgi:hypothetical protein